MIDSIISNTNPMIDKFNFLFLDDSNEDNSYVDCLLRMEELPVKAHFETNPAEALAYLRKVSPEKFPNVIMVDVNMPIMNGFEWAECYLLEFYLNHPDTIIFMVSTSPEIAKNNELADNPVIAGFLPKPFSKELFDEKIYDSLKMKFSRMEMS